MDKGMQRKKCTYHQNSHVNIREQKYEWKKQVKQKHLTSKSTYRLSSRVKFEKKKLAWKKRVEQKYVTTKHIHMDNRQGHINIFFHISAWNRLDSVSACSCDDGRVLFYLY